MSRPMTAGDSSLAELLARPLAETTTEQLATLFEKGAKSVEQWMIGLEIELVPLAIGAPEPVQFPAISQVFERLSQRRAMEADREQSGALVGLKGLGHILSLEPGGQAEIATKPYRRLRELNHALASLCRDLAECGQAQGVRFIAIGHHPYADRDSIPKMPKARYDAMRGYLPKRGARGLDMMHLTGSVQCAVDFSDEANMTDKVRTAARVSPFLTALVSASPFSSGKPNGMKTMRYEIWRDVDNPRCGIWKEMVDEEGLTFRRYVEHALDVPAMFFMRDGRYALAEPKPYRSFAQSGFQGTPVTVADFVDHLTTMFPEIRVKSYVELRGADCVMPAEAVAIAGFWRAILDSDSVRRAVNERLGVLSHGDLLALQLDVARRGLDATSPAGDVRELARWLTRTAHEHLRDDTPDCAECVMPLVERAQRGKSPADEMLEAYARAGIEAAIAPCTLGTEETV